MAEPYEGIVIGTGSGIFFQPSVRVPAIMIGIDVFGIVLDHFGEIRDGSRTVPHDVPGHASAVAGRQIVGPETEGDLEIS